MSRKKTNPDKVVLMTRPDGYCAEVKQADVDFYEKKGFKLGYRKSKSKPTNAER